MCRQAKEESSGLENFHFHMLRHTFTSNLLSSGAAPRTRAELLGHADVSTDEYLRPRYKEAKRTSARLMDKKSAGVKKFPCFSRKGKTRKLHKRLEHVSCGKTLIYQWLTGSCFCIGS